ncbi:MAG: flavin reductase [Victivallales bacterium]|jgi:flavin reductase (DIM6/NTAB) family NADH-FMN oxidoreductase RutF|nr:flavin reductase [Victivallales bacterium]
MTKSKMRKAIDPASFTCSPFRSWQDDWLVLAAGSFPDNAFNAMTVGWGFWGCIWGVPAVTVFLRPQRYTLEFLEHCDTFTLSAFEPKYRKSLVAIGESSGRDVPDKLVRAGLTPEASDKVDAPSFAEAELVLECRKLYRGELFGRNFIDKSLINTHYTERDYHISFVGKVLRIFGDEKYLNSEALFNSYGRH